MIELHLPWLELSLLMPVLGALFVRRLGNAEVAQKRCVLFSLATLVCAVGAWLDFGTLHTFEAHDHWDVVSKILGSEFCVIDELSAPLLPLSALLFLLTAFATTARRCGDFRFPGCWLPKQFCWRRSAAGNRGV